MLLLVIATTRLLFASLSEFLLFASLTKFSTEPLQFVFLVSNVSLKPTSGTPNSNPTDE